MESGACSRNAASKLAESINCGIGSLLPEQIRQQAGESKIIFMKYFFVILFFILTSCAPVTQPVVADAQPEITSAPTLPRLALATFEPTNTAVSPSTPIETQTVQCDPFAVDFCITDGHFIFQRPLKLPANDSVDPTYRYGGTENGTRDPHHGVDMGNPIGTPVYAAGDGQVVYAGSDKEIVYGLTTNFYGNVIVIKHENDLFTLYGHLSKIVVEAGQTVHAGDEIGEVGSEGVAIGSHLHFEVRRGGDGRDYFSTLNPELWMIPKSDESGNPFGALAVSIVDENHQFVKYSEFTARFYHDRNGPKIKSYYLVTYPLNMANESENAALGDLAPGYYYIALKVNDHVYQRWVEVKSGKLTQAVFVVTTR